MLMMMSCCVRSLRRLATRNKLPVNQNSGVNRSPFLPRSKDWILGHGLCTRASGDTAAHSPSSTYFSVHIRCDKHVAEIFSEALLCFGASSTSMDELSSSEDIDVVGISSIFTNDQDVHACLSSAANSIGLKRTPSYEITIGDQCEWIKNMQGTFHPIEVTDGLWIVPEWVTPPNIQATNIILDPGMAFGTGEHPTTKLCLLLLNGLIKGGECFLDYGTGSGVLGIAAVKMGAAMSVGVDIDPQAILSASQNIALNEIEPDKMLLYLAPNDITSFSWDGKSYDNVKEQTYISAMNARKEKFDIVIANILLNPLLELVEDIITFGKPGAVIGVSGILSEQISQIKERYSKYLDDISVSEMDGWACVSGTRKILTNF